MVNKCCLHYCKSGKNGFAFPHGDMYPDLREKWITFVSQLNFEPSQHTRICIEHFEEKYIKYGAARNHLKWNMMPIPTIHTNDEHNKSILPSSLSVPKTLRKGPRKRIFQEDQLGDFLERDRITDFASLSQADCLPGFTELSPYSQEVSANVAGYVACQLKERIDCTECAGKVESKGRSTTHSSYPAV